jgi:hypothetical protein
MSIMASVSNMKAVKNLTNYFVVLKVDESIEQTKKILSKQRQDETLEGVLKNRRAEMIKRKHRNAQWLLKQYNVINPYAKDIECNVPDARSIQPKYLTLTKTICLVRQNHKEVKRFEDTGEEFIEIDLIDIEIANGLMAQLLRGARSLSEEAEKTLKDIEELTTEKAGVVEGEKEALSFTVKELAAFSSLSDYKARTVIEELEKAGYLEHLAGSNGKTMQYRLSKKDTELKPELLKPFESGVKRSEACK